MQKICLSTKETKLLSICLPEPEESESEDCELWRGTVPPGETPEIWFPGKRHCLLQLYSTAVSTVNSHAK